jgi:hypothetical protein
MAGPFAAQPTPYRVVAGTRAWWANCAWDMLGIAAMVGEPVDIDARCTDCDEPMPLHVAPNRGIASMSRALAWLVNTVRSVSLAR